MSKPENAGRLIGTVQDQVTTHLARRGYTLPADPLAHEIITVAVERWGSRRVIAGLARHLDGPEPTYALEPLGVALGPAFECPHQLIETDTS